VNGRAFDPAFDGPRERFELPDIVSATSVAFIVLFAFMLMFQTGERELKMADISDEKAKPIAVAITPVPLLKQGSKTPQKLPNAWQRQQPKPAAKQEEAPLPSPQAAKTPDAIPSAPVPDAAVAPVLTDAAVTGPTDPAATPTDAAAPAASSEGDPSGSPKGTETDPLKARAVNLYRAQLAAFFLARFAIRGKVPFDKLKTLRGAALVNVGADRSVTGFSITSPSGDATFDAEMKNALQGRVGASLPPPPPMYPDILGTSFPVGFSCTVEQQCQ
jgi:hypothetical protein